MRKLFLLLCALVAAIAANAQTLAGVPQYGVTLAGTIDNLQIINASGRDILGASVHYRDAHGDGPVDVDLVTSHVRHGKTLTSIPWGSSPALKVKKNIVSITLDAVVFGDGEYVSAAPSTNPTQNFDSFHLLTVELESEKTAARDKVHWSQLLAGNLSGSLDAAAISVIQERVARDLLSIRSAEGDRAANAAADRSSKLPQTWRRPQAPPTGLAWFLRAFAPVLAQGQYGTFNPSTYTGDQNWGPTNVPSGSYSPEIGTHAQCLTPSNVAGEWMGMYLGPTYSGCPNGSDMSTRIQWQYPGNPPSGYILAGYWLDRVPADPPGNGLQQGSWNWYNWCANLNNGPILYGHCNYGCAGGTVCGR